jgi:hypothetical protein
VWRRMSLTRAAPSLVKRIGPVLPRSKLNLAFPPQPNLVSLPFARPPIHSHQAVWSDLISWIRIMQAYQDQLLPPSGVSHALSVRLTPPLDAPLPDATIISHLVTARANQLQLWQVRERVTEDGEVSSWVIELVARLRLRS